MNNFSWKTPDSAFIQDLSPILLTKNEIGCDLNPVNLFLYSRKYDTKVSVQDGFLFRRYSENDTAYYGFPLFLETRIPSTADLQKALDFIKKDAGKKECVIHFATDTHILLLQNLLDSKSLKKLQISEERDLADYVYLQENLANLTGSKYQKKRNHIHQFIKKHPDAVFRSLTDESLRLAMDVENAWLIEAEKNLSENASPQEASQKEDLIQEKNLIETALSDFDKLKLSGGIVFCNETPVAMCIASVTNADSVDVHFEKAVEPFARDGAYAFINQNFSKTCTAKYLNREEDLGLENLRKAKESYYPEFLLKKYKIVIK